jgi:hypothetical protein
LPNDVRISLSGPIFDRRRRSRIIDEGVDELIKEILDAAEQDLALKMRRGPAGVFLAFDDTPNPSTGNARRHLQKLVKKNFGRIDLGRLIYGPWLEGVSPRNFTTRFKGYQLFRLTKQFLEREIVPKMVKRHKRKMIRRLNGGF